jgi:hypothetical protein
MTDPVTLGALGALALSKGAEALVSSGVGEVVKDAYQRLKSLLSKRGASEVATLESNPKSAARQAVIAELIDGLPANELDETRALVRQLTAALQAEVKRLPAGIEIEKLTAMNMELNSVQVGSGVGFKAKEVNLSGDLKVGNLTVGEPGKG